MSEHDIADCPKCGKRDFVFKEDNAWVCLNCGHTAKVKRSVINFVLKDKTSTVRVEGDSYLAEEKGEKDDLIQKEFAAKMPFETALAATKPAAEAIVEAFRALKDPCDAIEVELGIKLTAGFGAIIATGSGECTYRVKLTWNQKENTP